MTVEAVREALRRIAADGPVGTILHVGAGEGGELPAYLASGARQARLVEPNPMAAAALRRAARGAPAVSIDLRAAAAKDGVAALRVFNAAEFSSLRRPTGLRRLLPGLRTEIEIETPTVSASALIDETAAGSETGIDLLVVDAPGEERAVVEALAAPFSPRRVSRVVLRAGREPLYEGAESAKSLLRRLEAAGYALDLADETDRDRPCLALRRDPAGSPVAAALEAARTDLAAARRLQALRADEIRDLRGRCDRLLEETIWQGELLDRLAGRLDP